MSPEVVGLPTADERRRLEQQGRAPPPEAPPYTEKVDVWAVGVLAYELIVGKPPFEVDDEQETRRRILHDTALSFPGHVSAAAAGFIRAALAKSAAQRPSAAELMRHAWLRPHLAAAAASAAAGGDARGAALAALRSGGALAAAPGAAAAVAAASAVGRSASFSGFGGHGGAGAAAAAASAAAVAAVHSHHHHQQQHHHHLAAHRPQALVLGDAPLTGTRPAAMAASSAGPVPRAGASLGGYAFAPAMASPTGSSASTPGPYGAGGRKPVWEADRPPAGGAFTTTLRTVGLSGSDSAALSSSTPSSSAASPPASAAASFSSLASPSGRSKLSGFGAGALAGAGGSFSGSPASGGSASGNPLLKAALNASLSRAAAAATLAPSPPLRAPAAATSGLGLGGGGGGGGAAGVKARLKEYFVARSTNGASVGAGTLT